MPAAQDEQASGSTPSGAALARTMDASSTEARAVPQEPVTVTQRLGRFVLLRKLGEGGMGRVFAAYDEHLDRRVAVKLLRRLDKEQSANRLRVLREAQAMARVSHENVLHVYEVGELGGQIFIAMEFVDGMSLSAWLRQQKPSWRELLAIYRQAGLGLLAAHQTGLVHRDFKPDNVLVDNSRPGGRARVADFGLARLHGSADSHDSAEVPISPSSALQSPATREGLIAGTPGYMSPEQYRGGDIDARSDQFSFCVALYEALYGRAPWSGDDVAAVAAETLAGNVRPPPSTAVPSQIFAALKRGLSTDPAARFPSMAELLDELNPDDERESAGTATWRRWLIALGSAGVVVNNLLMARTVIRRGMSLRELTDLMAYLVIGMVVVVILARRTLLKNTLHRRLLGWLLTLGVTSLAIRIVGLAMHFSPATLLPFDFVAVGGITACLAQQLLPIMWSAAAVFGGATVAALLWPQYAVLIAIGSYMFWWAPCAYGWIRLTQKKRDANRTNLATAADRQTGSRSG